MADELRISDWISDVCSSDLEARARAPGGTATGPAPRLDCRPPRPRIRFMVWLYLLLALAAFAVALKSTSIALAVVCLPAALGFLVACVLGLLARRIGSQSRDESLILDPDELTPPRDQAHARPAPHTQSREPPAALSDPQ